MALLGATSGSKTVNAEWFVSDLAMPPSNSGTLKMHFSLASAAVVQYTLDSGTTWLPMNRGVAFAADEPVVLSFPMGPDALFNMRQTTGTVTVNICEVHRF